MIERKHIIAIDFAVVFGSLFVIALLVGYTQPRVIAPIDGYFTNNSSVLFSFEKADLILIDNNLEFSSPQEIYVENNFVINLKPGIYYWKVVGALESAVRELTIQSEVSLKLVEDGEKVSVVNSGNTPLNVDIYENGALSGNIVLDVNEREEVSGEKYVGRENE
jgi:hypothetical protein